MEPRLDLSDLSAMPELRIALLDGDLLRAVAALRMYAALPLGEAKAALEAGLDELIRTERPPAELASLAQRYRAGGIGHAEVLARIQDGEAPWTDRQIIAALETARRAPQSEAQATAADVAGLPDVVAALDSLDYLGALTLLRRHTNAGGQEAAAALQAYAERSPIAQALPAELLELAAAAGGMRLVDPEVLARWPAELRRAAGLLARRLSDRAWELAEEAHDGRISGDEMKLRLRADCPGFSEAAYSDACEQALRDSR